MKLSLNVSNTQLQNICGVLNANIKTIEHALNTKINNKGAEFSLNGSNAEIASKILLQMSKYDKKITEDIVNLEIKHFNHDSSIVKYIKLPKKQIKISNNSQLSYIDNIDKHDCIFAIGVAGTGKTYLGVAKAIEALLQGSVERIMFVRPVVEAGENLGFLPGDMNEKIDPYLTPIYDAMYEFIGKETVEKLLENKTIEIAPLAFMRGRTLNSVFVILDEAQNTTRSQMKMFLTRLGFNSKMIITGDQSQIDLPNKSDSGLIDAINILKNVKHIAWNYFDVLDVLRHDLVSQIIRAYEKK